MVALLIALGVLVWGTLIVVSVPEHLALPAGIAWFALVLGVYLTPEERLGAFFWGVLSFILRVLLVVVAIAVFLVIYTLLGIEVAVVAAMAGGIAVWL